MRQRLEDHVYELEIDHLIVGTPAQAGRALVTVLGAKIRRMASLHAVIELQRRIKTSDEANRNTQASIIEGRRLIGPLGLRGAGGKKIECREAILQGDGHGEF